MDRFRRSFGKSLARLAFAFGVPKVGYALFLSVLPWGIETGNTANSRKLGTWPQETIDKQIRSPTA